MTQESQIPDVNDEANAVLNSAAASGWIKRALQSALYRDPVDAANDAEFLSSLLSRRADAILAQALRGVSEG